MRISLIHQEKRREPEAAQIVHTTIKSPFKMKTDSNRGIIEWLSKTIETCSSLLHLETAERLIENYKRSAHDVNTANHIDWLFKVKALKMDYYRWKSTKEFGKRPAA